MKRHTFEKPFYSPAEVASMIGVDRLVINRAIKSKELKAVRLTQRTSIVSVDDLNKWLVSKEEQTNKPTKNKTAQSEQTTKEI